MSVTLMALKHSKVQNICSKMLRMASLFMVLLLIQHKVCALSYCSRGQTHFTRNIKLRKVSAINCHSSRRKLLGAVSFIPHTPTIQFASIDGNDGDAEEFAAENNAPKSKLDIPDPPRFLAAWYNVAALLNVVTAIALICNYPNPLSNNARIISVTSSTASNVAARYQPNLLATYTAGTFGHLFLAGGSCHIIANAARTKRLFTSDTYKRLTFGTLLFGFVGLWSFPGEAGINTCFSMNALNSLILAHVSKFVTALVSLVGWKYGSGGFDSSSNQRWNMMEEVANGYKNLWKTLPVTDDRPASFYRTFFLLVTILSPLCNFLELSFNLRQGVGLFSLPASLNISSLARLGLLSVILYVLKDASDRDRLDGSTFIKLNVSVGLWALGVGIAQGFGEAEFSLRRAADKLLFAALFLNNGIISQLRKLGLMKKEDNDSDQDPPLRVNLF